MGSRTYGSGSTERLWVVKVTNCNAYRQLRINYTLCG